MEYIINTIRQNDLKNNKLSKIVAHLMAQNNIPNTNYLITGSYGFGSVYPTNNIDVLIDPYYLSKLNIPVTQINNNKFKYDLTPIYNNYYDDNANDFSIYFHTKPISNKYVINTNNYQIDQFNNRFITGKLLMDFRNDINRPVILMNNPLDSQTEYYFNKYKKYKHKYRNTKSQNVL